MVNLGLNKNSILLLYLIIAVILCLILFIYFKNKTCSKLKLTISTNKDSYYKNDEYIVKFKFINISDNKIEFFDYPMGNLNNRVYGIIIQPCNSSVPPIKETYLTLEFFANKETFSNNTKIIKPGGSFEKEIDIFKYHNYREQLILGET